MGLQHLFLAARAALLAGGFAAITAGAQELPPTALSVIGGIGTSPQFLQFEKPFWTEEIKAKSNGRVTATSSPGPKWA